MAKGKPAEAPRLRPVKGGSYIRNKETGELRPNAPAQPPTETAPSEVNDHG